MSIVKVDIDHEDEIMVVRFRGRSWELAHKVIQQLKEAPPKGYRMVESQVKPTSMHKSGRRCMVQLTFFHYSSHLPPLTPGGAKAFFEPYHLIAEGVTP